MHNAWLESWAFLRLYSFDALKRYEKRQCCNAISMHVFQPLDEVATSDKRPAWRPQSTEDAKDLPTMMGAVTSKICT